MRGCVEDDILEYFDNPDEAGCTDANDLPNDYRDFVIGLTSGFYSAVSSSCMIPYMYMYIRCTHVHVKYTKHDVTRYVFYARRIYKEASAAVTTEKNATVVWQSTEHLLSV